MSLSSLRLLQLLAAQLCGGFSLIAISRCSVLQGSLWLKKMQCHTSSRARLGTNQRSCGSTFVSQRSSSRCRQQAVPIPELASIATSLESIVNELASHAGPLQPAVQVIGGDIASVAALSPTLPGVARLTVRVLQPVTDVGQHISGCQASCGIAHCKQDKHNILCCS
jgi:hypothetical protein